MCSTSPSLPPSISVSVAWNTPGLTSAVQCPVLSPVTIGGCRINGSSPTVAWSYPDLTRLKVRGVRDALDSRAREGCMRFAFGPGFSLGLHVIKEGREGSETVRGEGSRSCRTLHAGSSAWLIKSQHAQHPIVAGCLQQTCWQSLPSHRTLEGSFRNSQPTWRLPIRAGLCWAMQSSPSNPTSKTTKPVREVQAWAELSHLYKRSLRQ